MGITAMSRRRNISTDEAPRALRKSLEDRLVQARRERDPMIYEVYSFTGRE
jgi:hypothetical protein